MPENENPQQPVSEVKAEPPKPLPSPFYADGYTRLVTVPSDLTGFSPIRMTYRPICADEHSKAGAWMRLNPDAPTIDHYAPLLATKIIDWTLADDKGNKVPVLERNVRRLAPSFYGQLLDIVSGNIPLPDHRVEAGPALKN